MSKRRQNNRFLPISLLCSFLLIEGCGKKESFPKIGTNIASPIDIVSSPEQDYFYVLNADLNRTYNKGSLLVLDQDGNKVTSIETPRLGRSLTVVDKVVIATFQSNGDEKAEGTSSVQLYNIEDSAAPKLTKSLELDCSPLNATARSGYRYFAVSCEQGGLYIGDLVNKTMKKVRDQNYNRRALYIDPIRNLLFAFVTDLGEADFSDQVQTDLASWDADFNKTDGANEVPDVSESTARALRGSATTDKKFKVLIYDIAAESAELDTDGDPFPFRESDSDEAQKELRWLYFNLTDFDGSPDNPSGYSDQTTKYYRTNFWAAKPDPQNANAFYLSHRGIGTAGLSPDANNIIRVTITGDIRADSEGNIPKTSDFFSFKRIYGFGGTQNLPDKPTYPGDFELTYSQGEPVVIVNNYRDLVNFKSVGGARFTISAATINASIWFDELESSKSSDGFHQIALGKKGRVATCSFYGDTVILLEVKTGAAITEIKRVN